MTRSKPGRLSQTTLRARYVFPVVGEPIADGTVTFQGGQIIAVGPSNTAPSTAQDLGNVALLPGFINAHIHLDASNLTAPLGIQGISLVDWIRCLMQSRAQPSTHSASSDQVVRLGLQESLLAAVTTLADFAQPGWPTNSATRQTVNLLAFQELIAPTAERIPGALQLGEEFLENIASGHPPAPILPGLGPHAPYSVHQRLLAAVVQLSCDHQVPVAMHLAESCEELELLKTGGGPFRDFLEERGAWESDAIARGSRPLDYLRQLVKAPRAVIVHGNYLDDEEIQFISAHRERMSVVYCPRTHDWFGHHPYPLVRMLAAGITVALGTDGRGSSPDLSLLGEMRYIAQKWPALDRCQILQMGTLAGACALGWERAIGSLQPGKQADFAVVALPDRTSRDPYELLFDSQEPVVACYWHGERAKSTC